MILFYVVPFRTINQWSFNCLSNRHFVFLTGVALFCEAIGEQDLSILAANSSLLALRGALIMMFYQVQFSNYHFCSQKKIFNHFTVASPKQAYCSICSAQILKDRLIDWTDPNRPAMIPAAKEGNHQWILGLRYNHWGFIWQMDWTIYKAHFINK